MGPKTAAIMSASAIGAAAGVPLSEASCRRAAAFWKASERFGDDDFDPLFYDLLSKIAVAARWLQELVGDEPTVPRRHVKALHDRIMHSKRSTTRATTRLCQPEFDWLADG